MSKTLCDLNNHTFCYGNPDTLTFECDCPCHEELELVKIEPVADEGQCETRDQGETCLFPTNYKTERGTFICMKHIRKSRKHSGGH